MALPKPRKPRAPAKKKKEGEGVDKASKSTKTTKKRKQPEPPVTTATVMETVSSSSTSAAAAFEAPWPDPWDHVPSAFPIPATRTNPPNMKTDPGPHLSTSFRCTNPSLNPTLLMEAAKDRCPTVMSLLHGNSVNTRGPPSPNKRAKTALTLTPLAAASAPRGGPPPLLTAKAPPAAAAGSSNPAKDKKKAESVRPALTSSKIKVKLNGWVPAGQGSRGSTPP